MDELRELDKQCAQELGYTVYHYDKDHPANCYYMLMDREFDPVVMRFRDGERRTEAEAWADVPRFTKDHVAARLLEDEIERRGLYREYCDILESITQQSRGKWEEAGDIASWRVIRALPVLRARAFLKVTKRHG